MSLALREPNGVAMPGDAGRRAPVVMEPADVWDTAIRVAKSGLFPGASTPEQAYTMMLVCVADGLHPIEAIRRFHVIEGRPAMRADAIQAVFQSRGGIVHWIKSDEKECEAEFSHPSYHPEPFRVRMELKRFVDNKVAMSWDKDAKGYKLKKNWANWPDAMLRARVVAAGVRAVDPGVIVGISSVEEAHDVLAVEAPEPVAVTLSRQAEEARAAVAAAEVEVPGQTLGPDGRPYHLVVADAVEILNRNLAEAGAGPQKPTAFHGHLMNRAIQLGLSGEPASRKPTDVIRALAKVYEGDRPWVRTELRAWCEGVLDAASAEAAARAEAEAAHADAEGAGPAAAGREPGEEG